MTRTYGWMLLSVAGAALAVTVIGPTVFGQPDPRTGLPKGLPTGVPTSPPIITRTEPLRSPVPPASGSSLPTITTQSIPPAPSSSTPSAPTPSTSTAPLFPRSESTTITTATTAPIGKSDKESTEIRVGKQQPAVSIEWVGPSTARVNQMMPCQLVVRNASNGLIHNVVVRQRLPRGVSCKATEPQATEEQGELVWNLGTLPPEQSRRLEVHLVSPTRGPVVCHASVTFTGAVSHQVQVNEPQLMIKMRAPERVVADEVVTLLFAISNPGDGIAESVRLKVQLPEGLDFKGGRTADVEIGNLGPRDIRTLELPCVAKGSGVQKCLASVSAEGGITAADTAQVDILAPKLDLVLTGPKLRYLDRPAVYVIKVSNPGSAPASNVEVQEVLPAGFKFNQANHGGQYQEATRTISWTLGDLQPGQSKEIAVDVVPTETGEHRLVAQARSARGLKIDAETRTLVEGLPSLVIDLSNTDNPVEVGAETAYELRVLNTGTKSETGVEVVCLLPEQFEFKGAKCSTTLRYRVEGRQVVFEPLPKLAPRADVIYRIQVRGTAPGDVRFRARIKSDGMREAALREESTRIYSDEILTRPQTGATPSSPPTSAPAPFAPTPSAPVTSTPAPSAPTTSAPMAVAPSAPAPITLPIPAPLKPSSEPRLIPAPAAPVVPLPKSDPVLAPAFPSPTPTKKASPGTETTMPAPSPVPTKKGSTTILIPAPAANPTSIPLPAAPAPTSTSKSSPASREPAPVPVSPSIPLPALPTPAVDIPAIPLPPIPLPGRDTIPPPAPAR